MLIFPILDLIVVAIAIAAALVLRDISRLAPSPRLQRAWFSLAFLLGGCATLVFGHAILLLTRPAELTDMISTATFVMGVCLIYGIAWLARRTTRELLRMEGLAHAAYQDALTGIGNRRRFMESLETAIVAARAFNRSLCVLAIDIDHFKRVNDTYGHAAGDAVLMAVATHLEVLLEGQGRVCRTGGEEFGLLLPSFTPAMASELAERLRADIAALRIDLGNGAQGRVTISLGLAVWRMGEMPADLLRRADQALYAAKGDGRNLMRMAG